MTEMSSQFQPHDIEAKLFDTWLNAGYFEMPIEEAKKSDKEPFIVTIPPPNVTGVLHLGHALNDTIQDCVVRAKRMQGHPTRWVLGTDHAGIATQHMVEKRLRDQGTSRHEVGREKFIEACWEWTEEHGSFIIEQVKRIGCSCDYSDLWFTMDDSYQRAVREAFVDWWDAGYIYRGLRIINWCPSCLTTLADDEVEHEDTDGHLWHIKYPLTEAVGDITHIEIATTRPETMLGDVAVAVSPSDDRYRDLVGKTVTLPLVGREIPIIADFFVDASFGTGMVKVTPAHDPNDHAIGERHNLEELNIMNEDATINEAGGVYAGLDRYEARARIVADLEEQGLLAKTEDHDHAVGHCYRCDTVIEPYLSEQWFVDMQELVKPAIKVVEDKTVKFYPERHARTYLNWMENIKNWTISRQLWWGHRIPVFYCDECGEVVASKTDITACAKCDAPVRQDEDVLDTWFSSQLWPFATFGWPEKTPELEYSYPTSVLSTARDIINLWVARMIVSGMYFIDDKIPFSDVIIHPTILDKYGRRMSKSLGNGIDPIELIEEYGADAMRFGLLSMVTSSQDVRMDKDKIAVYRNFANKIWNAARFVLMNAEDYSPSAPKPQTVADRWILSRLAALSKSVDEHLEAYEFSELTRELYDFFWSEYCDWYIELSKAQLQGSAEERESAQSILVYVLDQSLRLLHPLMPFITEEIWQKLPGSKDEADSLMVAAWPDSTALQTWSDAEAEEVVGSIKALVSALRAVRARYGISPRQELEAHVRVASDKYLDALKVEQPFISSLANISNLVFGTDTSKPEASVVVVESDLEIFVPLAGLIDFKSEKEKLSKQREKLAKDLEKFERKLSNPGFLAKAAPEIIEKDRAVAAELKTQIASIDLQMAELG